MADDITIQRTEAEIQVVIGAAAGSSLASLNDTTITSPLDNHFLYYASGAWINNTAANARTALGLGTIATQAANSVDIDGGAIDGTAIGANSASTGAFTSVNIDGGAIDGTAIGANSASTGAFTTLDTTGAVTFNDNTVTRAELKDYAETRTTPSSSANALTLDIENGNVFEVTLTENVTTTTFSNPSATGKGCSFTLILKQDGVGGHTFAWPASVDWKDATPPTLTTTASAVDILTFMTTDGGTRWYGFLAGSAMG